MIKTIFPAFLLLLFFNHTMAQKVVTNPKFKASTYHKLKIEKIELRDTVTVVDIHLDLKKYTVRYKTSRVFLENENGGKKYFLKGAEGIDLNTTFKNEDGFYNFTLYFDPLPEGTKTINYIEPFHRIGGIELVAQEHHEEQIPNTGDWFNTNGSNELVLRLLKKAAIYRDTLWKIKAVNSKCRNTVISLTNSANESLILNLKPSQKGQLSITDENNTTILCKSEKNPNSTVTRSENRLYKSDTFFSEPETAILKGFISDYHPALNNQIYLFVDNMVDNKKHHTTIDCDGFFECKVLLYHPTFVQMRYMMHSRSFLLEPGKTTNYYLPLGEFVSSPEALALKEKKGTQELFFGHLGDVNAQLLELSNNMNFDYSQPDILELSLTQYLQKVDEKHSADQQKLQNYFEKGEVGKRVKQIAQYRSDAAFYNAISGYLTNKSMAEYRKTRKFKGANKKERDIYDEVIKRYFPDSIRKDVLFLLDGRNFRGFKGYLQEVPNNINSSKISNSFITDLSQAMSLLRSAEKEFKVINEQELSDVTNKIRNSYIRAYVNRKLQELSKSNQNVLDQFNTATGFTLHETPSTTDADLFNTILKQYEGKVVHVDFWATWCGPCRSYMKQMEVLKEKYMGKDIVFVYITNHTSPETTYKVLASQSKGDHYRVTAKQWNEFKERFNITGIPRCLLFDKQGNLVNDNLRANNETLENTFNKYL